MLLDDVARVAYNWPVNGNTKVRRAPKGRVTTIKAFSMNFKERVLHGGRWRGHSWASCLANCSERVTTVTVFIRPVEIEIRWLASFPLNALVTESAIVFSEMVLS